MIIKIRHVRDWPQVTSPGIFSLRMRGLFSLRASLEFRSHSGCQRWPAFVSQGEVLAGRERQGRQSCSLPRMTRMLAMVTILFTRIPASCWFQVPQEERQILLAPSSSAWVASQSQRLVLRLRDLSWARGSQTWLWRGYYKYRFWVSIFLDSNGFKWAQGSAFSNKLPRWFWSRCLTWETLSQKMFSSLKIRRTSLAVQ